MNIVNVNCRNDWSVNRGDGVRPDSESATEPASGAKTERIGQCHNQGRCRLLRPALAPVDNPHRQPDAERGEGDTEGCENDVDLVPQNATPDILYCSPTS